MPDTYFLGDVVPLTFTVCDEDGEPANATGASLAVTRPDLGTDTPTLANPEPGRYQADYTPGAAGRYIAVAVFTGVNAGAATDVFDVLPTSLALVTLADAQEYLGDTSATPAQIASALDAERQAQADVCRIDDYTAALREALLRRVARNLAARAVPVTSFTSFDGGGTATRVPARDPEIGRLESKYRRWSVG